MTLHTILLLITSILLLLILPTLSSAILPSPTGPYQTAHLALPFTDVARNDYGASTFFNLTIPRSIMTSFYYPLGLKTMKCFCLGNSNESTTPYFPPITGRYLASKFEIPEFADLRLPSSQSDDGGYRRIIRPKSKSKSSPSYQKQVQKEEKSTFPLLIFSPAFATSRLLYSSLLSELASYGYVIISIDHPYDTDIVEFSSTSSGSEEVIYAPSFLDLADTDEDSLLAYSNTAQEIRAEDMRFLLDIILKSPSSSDTLEETQVPIRSIIDKSNIFTIGHSLGGASSLLALHQDIRIKAAINLDGFLFGPASNSYLPDFGVPEKPFLLFSSNNSGGNAESWDRFWNFSSSNEEEEGKMKTHKQIQFTNAEHFDFSDLPLALDVLGKEELTTAELRDEYPISRESAAKRKQMVVSAFVRGFLKWVGKESEGEEQGRSSFEDEMRMFPEVEVIR